MVQLFDPSFALENHEKINDAWIESLALEGDGKLLKVIMAKELPSHLAAAKGFT